MISNSLNSVQLKISLLRHVMRLLCLHEKNAYQSIQMLWSQDLSFWAKAQAMCSMSKNMESPRQKTWPSRRQDSHGFAQTDFLSATKLAERESALSIDSSRIDVSISKNTPTIRPKKIYTETSLWSAYSSDRWTVVFLQRRALDTLSGGTQTAQRASCDFFGSFACERDRKLERMDAISRDNPSRSQKTHLRFGLRQFSWFEAFGPSKSLDTSTLPFSPDSSVPIQERTLETRNWPSRRSGIDLSTGSSSSGASRRRKTPSCFESPADDSASGTHSSIDYVGPRALEKYRSLSKFSDLSGAEPSHDDKHYRIDESADSRSDASSWKFMVNIFNQINLFNPHLSLDIYLILDICHLYLTLTRY